LASLPTASTRPFTLLIATIDGSLTTMPLPRAYTHVLAVPRSMARSLENTESIERRLNESLLRVRRRRRRSNAVLPGVLDLIHGGVGGLQQRLRRGRHLRQRRDADRRREAAVEAVRRQKRMVGNPL